VAPAVEGTVVSFLADFGIGLGAAGILSTAPSYPLATQHDVRNMAVRVLNGIVGTPGGAVTFELLRNGSPVPGFVAVFTVGGPVGNQLIHAGPVSFAEGSRLDLRATATGVTAPVNVSASIGIE
jgi:hypothetical protein